MNRKEGKTHAKGMLLGFGLLAVLGATGCQVDLGGQTHPSGFYPYDDVQYFAPGPEFPLEDTAAALKRAKAGEDGAP